MNKIGACIWSLPGSSMREKIKLAEACGLDGVQLDLGSPEDGFPLSQKRVITELRDLREETGLAYPSIGLNVFCERSATDSTDHPFLREALDAALKAAEVLDVPILQIPSFSASEINSEMDLELTAELFAYICRKASGTGITVASENVLLPEQLEKLVQKVDAPNFGIYFDTANPKAMLGLDAIPFLEASFSKLVQVHLKDSRDDKVPVLLGEGDTDFPCVYDRIRQSGYDGWFVLESPYNSLTRKGDRSAADLLLADLKTARG